MCPSCLKVASNAYHYYVSIGRTPSPGNMNYTQVLKSFWIEYEALTTLADEAKPDVPILTKNQTPLRWRLSLSGIAFSRPMVFVVLHSYMLSVRMRQFPLRLLTLSFLDVLKVPCIQWLMN